MSIRDEAIEAAAKAICEARGLDWDAQASFMTSAGGSDEEQDGFRDDATAAFDAIMERLARPDEGMIDAGWRAHGDPHFDPDPVWQAMINSMITPTKAEREGE